MQEDVGVCVSRGSAELISQLHLVKNQLNYFTTYFNVGCK